MAFRGLAAEISAWLVIDKLTLECETMLDVDEIAQELFQTIHPPYPSSFRLAAMASSSFAASVCCALKLLDKPLHLVLERLPVVFLRLCADIATGG